MKEELKPLDFSDLTPYEEKVPILGKVYTLREASGQAGTRYRNKMLESMRLGPEGKPQSINGMSDAEPLLVSLCLFDEAGVRPVPIQTITSWPDRIQKALAKRIKEVSELDEPDTVENLEKQMEELQKKLDKARVAEDARKNSSGDTMDGSE